MELDELIDNSVLFDLLKRAEEIEKKNKLSLFQYVKSIYQKKEEQKKIVETLAMHSNRLSISFPLSSLSTKEKVVKLNVSFSIIEEEKKEEENGKQ